MPTLLLWLGPINVLLGVFNVLPGFPLDGGRVLRAILWGATNDLVKATRWASFAGHGLAWMLMAAGVLELLAGALVQGMWLILIGWFLNNAARMSYRQVLTRHALEDVPVRRVMWSQPQRVSPRLTLDRFVNDHVMASEQVAFPVESEDGALVGLVELGDVRKVPLAQWPNSRVDEIMTRIVDLPTLGVDAAAHDALDVLVRNDLDQVSVLEGSELRGMVRRRDLLKWISMQTREGAATLMAE
jgi:CBS domain-containing protein